MFVCSAITSYFLHKKLHEALTTNVLTTAKHER